MKTIQGTSFAVLLVLLLILSAPSQREDATATQTKEMPKSIIGRDGAKMVLIPAGEFQMGSPEGEGDNDEHPQHKVFLDAFYIDKYEVTNAQYNQFMEATGHKAPWYWNDEKYNQPDQPVMGVSWYDAKAYCEWAGKRLPTEAQWEKAARGGLVGKRYSWGDDWPPPAKAGNFADETAKKEFAFIITGYDDGYTYPAPVGSFKPNGYGLCDMAGNVWEWCADWCDNSYYARSPKDNPTGPNSGRFRIVRGGSWVNNSANDLRAPGRDGRGPMLVNRGVGFRCAGLNVTP